MLAKGCRRRARGEGTLKGQRVLLRQSARRKRRARPIAGAQPGHVVEGEVGAPSLGARFRCVILTFALYRSVGKDRRGDLRLSSLRPRTIPSPALVSADRGVAL